MKLKRWLTAPAAALLAAGGVLAAVAGTASAGTITPLPMQPAVTDYQPPSGNGSNAIPYEHQGALVVAGQSQLPSQNIQNAAAAGATVLGYLDPMVIQPNSGTWGDMLWQSSVCGAAVPQWGSFNSGTGYQIADFRTVADGGSGIEQAKLHCVLENMVSANPWIAGFFADDLGSKSWYPGLNWSTFGSANQQAWHDGAVALASTFHDVAVEHGGMLMVNGTWEKGTIASNGGGYPNLAANGVSYADGGYIEHHASSEVAFWQDYASGQWATATGDAAQGNPIMYVQASDLSTLNTYKATGVFSFGSYQTDYSQPAPVWGSFHATGLPSGSSSGTQSAPTVTTTAATGVTSAGATANGAVNPNGADASYKFDYGTTTAYGSSTTAGDAGAGTTAVNESANLTGLSSSTTYHYQIEATNSGGTTFGSDQQFTTSAAGGTSVAFDAAAGAKAANTTSLSWLTTVSSTGSNRELLVDETVGDNNDAGCAPSATYDGISMTEVTAVHDDNQRAGALVVWALTNPPAGTDTVHVAVSGCTGAVQEMTGGSESFTGVSQSSPLGAHATGFGSGTQSSVGVTDTSTSDLVGEFVSNGSAVGTPVSPVVQKFLENQDGFSGAGNTAGGYAPGAAGTVTGKMNLTNDWWGAGGVVLNHA